MDTKKINVEVLKARIEAMKKSNSPMLRKMAMLLEKKLNENNKES